MNARTKGFILGVAIGFAAYYFWSNARPMAAAE